MWRPERNQFVGLDACPYCRGTDVRFEDTRVESEMDARGPELSHDMICQDIDCENCGRSWTVEFRPVAYFTYDGGLNGRDFDPTPRALVAVQQD